MTWVTFHASLFDRVGGLPLHPLVLHLVVVGVPFMALVTVAVSARPSWRRRAGWPVVGLNVLLLAATWVTAEAGEALQARVGGELVARHAELGGSMVWFVGALLVASVVVALARERRGPGLASLVLSVVVGVAAVWWTYRVGHSGSEAVWGGIMEFTDP